MGLKHNGNMLSSGVRGSFAGLKLRKALAHLGAVSAKARVTLDKFGVVLEPLMPILQEEEKMEKEKRKICFWSDGTWCEGGELESHLISGASDDYAIIFFPVGEDIDDSCIDDCVNQTIKDYGNDVNEESNASANFENAKKDK